MGFLDKLLGLDKKPADEPTAAAEAAAAPEPKAQEAPKPATEEQAKPDKV